MTTLGRRYRRLAPRNRWRRPLSLDSVGLFAGLLTALAVGYTVARSPVAAALLVATIALAVAVGLVGRLLLTQVTLAALPWLVVFGGLLPPLVKTFAAAAAALSVLFLVGVSRAETRTLYVGVLMFLVTVTVATLLADSGDALIQAAKYLIFPCMAVAVTSKRGRELLPRTRTALLGSGLLAMAVHIVIIGGGLGQTGSYYDVGETLGFAESPHELALLGLVIAAAGLTTARRISTRVLYVCVALIPSLSTGVRSALVAVAVLFLLFLAQQRLNYRAVAVIAAVASVAFVSGAATIVTDRFRLEERQGEFLTSSEFGSGRQSIWRVSLDRWSDANPAGWVFGLGLRSIREINAEELGGAFVGHSDLVEIWVQVGLLGLVGWLLIWLALLRAKLRNLVLVPIAVYAVANGAIEYITPLVVGLVLAAACAPPHAARPRRTWRQWLPEGSVRGASPNVLPRH